MGDNRNYTALDWVVGEIGETLKEARQTLEAYVENPQDSTRIRFCLTHIHQVHGSLQMVEFFGAALLAEEMEGLAQAMMNRKISNDIDAQEVLMRAILQLPVYLDQVKASRNDDPAVLLPLLNDLRAARGASLLTESRFFSPNLSAAHQITGQSASLTQNREQFKAVVTKLRQMYQYAAAGVIRGVNTEENLSYLNKVFSRLHQLTQGTARQPLWDISLALLEGLSCDGIDVNVSVKTLLRQLDKEIKVLVDHGPLALTDFTRDELIKNLLYYATGSTVTTPRVERIRLQYGLENRHPSAAQNNLFAAPDLDTLRTVVSALNDELETIKSALDIGISGAEHSSVDDALPVMKRVADTLAVLGVGDLRKQMLGQIGNLEQATTHGEPEQGTLLTVAGEIIAIEQRLAAMARGTVATNGHTIEQELEIGLAQETVLREARNGLEQAKDAIIEYIASQWDRSHLNNVPALLTEIRGGLNMVPLPRPAAILQACGDFIHDQLLQSNIAPEWSTLDTLADAIASVEYYLERLCGDRDEDDELLLGLAEESLETLGYRVHINAPIERVAPTPADNTASAESVLEKIADIESVTLDTLPLSSDQDDSVDPNYDHYNSTAFDNAPDTEPLVDSTVLADTIQLSVTDEYATDTNIASYTSATEITDTDDTATTNTTVATEESDIDDEIIEIFIEEAREVLQTIAEFFPQWSQELNDRDALIEVRRAFHTLKGSGRMVGATAIGELSWSVENMLNRIMDGTIQPLAEHLNFISNVLTILPDMVNAFEARRGNPHDALTQKYQAWGASLSIGQIPEELATIEFTLPVSSAADDDNIDANTDTDPITSQAEDPTAVDNTADDNTAEDNAILWEIFGSEALGHLAVVESFIAEMEVAAPLYTPPSEQMQRALHTLKGSAHMADVTEIATLVTPLERFAKELRIYQVNIDDDILQLIRDGVEYTRQALEQIKIGAPVVIEKTEQFHARIAELKERSVGPLIRQKEAENFGVKPVDPHLLSIFMAEEMNLLLDAAELLVKWQEDTTQVALLEPLLKELATLSTGAEHANLPPMANLSSQLRQLYQAVIEHNIDVNDILIDDLLAGHEALLDLVDAVAAGQNVTPVTDAVQARIDRALATINSADTHELTLQQDEDETLAADIAESFIEAVADIANTDQPNNVESNSDVLVEPDSDAVTSSTIEHNDNALVDNAFLIDSAANDTETSNAIDYDVPTDNDIGAYAIDINLEAEATDHVEHPAATPTTAASEALDDDDDIDPEIIEIFIEEAEELLEDIEHAVHDWEENQEQTDSYESLKRSLHTLKGGARLAGITVLGDVAHDFETFLINENEHGAGQGVIDQVFFKKVHAYQDAIHNGIVVLKAVTAGEARLSDLANDMPALTDNNNSASAVIEPLAPLITGELTENSSSTQDATDAWTSSDDEANGTSSYNPADYSTVNNTFNNDSDIDADIIDTPPDFQAAAGTLADILPFTPKHKERPSTDFLPTETGAAIHTLNPANGGPAMAAQQKTTPLAARRSAPQEVVKVSAELLEELVNLAGETSISRGQVEEQISELGYTLDEMEATISRLQEQLRRLDIETEAQVLFRQEQLAEDESFDPLEMDRYSQLQQLSRSLIESASDLLDLKSTMSDKTRDTETLLLQQSRINTELQEGLMRSRMVPFSRMVPRLRRIVRQVSGELGKQVSFELNNVEGEMDRSVLERMVAPLEHMLRNAVDHGIESPEQRNLFGKAEAGRIILSLGREGGDVVLRLADDGQGINLQRVREKAIERGLMSADAQLSDSDIMQFILHAGFSTADKVSQISGRGVGMDVVHSEIKQLGGSMTIDSRPGEGTEFIIRLPFTVSVNRALMVRIGDDPYAVPLNTIEGIVRVSPFELEHYYQDEQARFEYAGEQYQMRYLGSLLNSDIRPKIEGQAMPMPVVLVRTAQHAIAMQVDQLMGSREIVVKSLGPQFSTVVGVSGATIMGDGSVVVILDPHAMIRREAALSHDRSILLQNNNATEHKEAASKTIMVVDDSVTVRKVTSRFLEREGYNVLTAKDGVDALRVLQDRIPNALLLDIEMPRMDGFELAKNIRSSSLLRHIPIIMITSRTGEKHRDHAMSLGVNKYMGKPFQEDELLHNIQQVTGDSSAPVTE